uniref:PH domain-containing protein n=1 Tax=Corethron hystrix TaxID=216773 RepID=A0A7S1B997_9STRA
MTFFCALAAFLIGNAAAFGPLAFIHKPLSETSCNMDTSRSESIPTNVCPSTLAGDPSLIMTTNIDLGERKIEIMKGESDVYFFTMDCASNQSEWFTSIVMSLRTTHTIFWKLHF